MIEWDSRMQNNHSVKVLKAAIPFLDVEVGQDIDMAGLLNAVRPFWITRMPNSPTWYCRSSSGKICCRWSR